MASQTCTQKEKDMSNNTPKPQASQANRNDAPKGGGIDKLNIPPTLEQLQMQLSAARTLIDAASDTLKQVLKGCFHERTRAEVKSVVPRIYSALILLERDLCVQSGDLEEMETLFQEASDAVCVGWDEKATVTKEGHSVPGDRFHELLDEMFKNERRVSWVN